MNPYLKWAGGKRSIVPAIRMLYENSGCSRLVEPFCGALSISLGVQPQKALVCDVNKALINLHQTIQTNPSFSDYSHLNNKDDFLRLRARFNELIDANSYTKETAEIFNFLNRTCFNGLWRVNKSKGHFNVGFGKYKKPLILTDFSQFQRIMEKWEIYSSDFNFVIPSLKKSDFAFIDPPYDGDKVFVGYSEGGFEWGDQVDLAHVVAKSEAKCVITNSDTPRLRELYKEMGFLVYQHTMPRMISCNGERQRAKELIAFKGFDVKEINRIRKHLTDVKKIR
ncbi:Dam family site-specific DNA-(adenine-N6)-methyltransferase [Vibrio coralliirubri]|uniref:DNA adenine methylase n=1 Tax=Vibrio coralliirubri TaxID=1516159 RepID=UPI0022836C8A|nr:Dam family site-specific DNA-(adenine-N6)-methyltransferase [Vibrio coralliirubri]MCY9861288.1 Dam family site-specific DNA-(adenine-N6)-methyltransferase [Vibrio coralliirubri]